MRLLILILSFSLTDSAAAADVEVGSTFKARDTLAPAKDESEDAQKCIEGLVWKNRAFEVSVEAARDGRGDWLIRFPSPINSGDERNDLVSMEWYQAQSTDGDAVTAPAVVVVHESGSGMTVGRLFARGLQFQGLHTFLIHLPHYGERRTAGKRPPANHLIAMMKQAIADVRRARDAVAALPRVDQSRISLQGTSLGGFVSATSAALDNGYSRVFLMLAGGDLFDVIQQGKKDAAKIRDRLQAAGVTGENLRQLTLAIEPLRVAHRLDPERTWLYSALFDTVVPVKNSLALAEAAKLSKRHHIQMSANHYTGVVYLPFVLMQIARHAGEPTAGYPAIKP